MAKKITKKAAAVAEKAPAPVVKKAPAPVEPASTSFVPMGANVACALAFPPASKPRD